MALIKRGTRCLDYSSHASEVLQLDYPHPCTSQWIPILSVLEDTQLRLPLQMPFMG